MRLSIVQKSNNTNFQFLISKCKWLRKLIKRKVIDKSDVSKYEMVIEKLRPKLNVFINRLKNNNTNFQFLISNCEWLRKLIKRKVIDKSDVSKYEMVIEKLGPKLNAFINSTKK